MWLDRSLIKQQAKELIRNRVLKLFAIAFIISLISGAGGAVYNIVYTFNSYNEFSDSGGYSSYEDYFNDNFGVDSYADDFNNFDGTGGNSYEDEFNNFGNPSSDQYADNFNSFGSGKITLPSAYNAQASSAKWPGAGYLLWFICAACIILSVLLLPLSVALPYFFVEYVTGKEFEFDSGLKSVFKNAFSVTYLKKLAAAVLVILITAFLSILFIVPGIIFSYSSYFTFEIMSEYPELSPWDAVKLSKKMIKGYRTELFVLDLSFIPWIMLCVFIFPAIYVWPYMYTTRALYYENFKMRALATGVVTEDDFLSDAQKYQKYMGGSYQNTPGGNAGPNYRQESNFQQQAPYQSQQQNPQGSSYPPQQGSTPYANKDSQTAPGAPIYQQQGGYSSYAQVYAATHKPVYFIPVMPAQREANGLRDLYGEFSASAAPPQSDAQEQPGKQDMQSGQTQKNTDEAPKITVSEPEDPQEPEFIQPAEPQDDLIKPEDPVDENE